MIDNWQMGLFYLCLAAFSLGISIQESILLLLLLFQMGLAMVSRSSSGGLLGPGRRLAFVFMAVLTLTAVAARYQLGDEGQTRIHWALIAFWALSPDMISRLNPVNLYRTLIFTSLPGMVYSLIQLLNPREISRSLEIGFQAYPKPEGFLSIPTTYAEGLVVILCWSLARVSGVLGKRERLGILMHMFISISFIAMTRDISSLVILQLVLLAGATLMPQARRTALVLLLSSVLMAAVIHPIFGWNSHAFDHWSELNGNAITLVKKYPVFGIGPNKFYDHPIQGSALTQPPRNTVLAMAGEAGLLGLTAYLLFMGAISLALYRKVRQCRDRQDPMFWLSRCLLLVFLTWWLFGTVVFNFSNSRLLIFHGLHWSLILQLGQPSQKARDKTREE